MRRMTMEERIEAAVREHSPHLFSTAPEKTFTAEGIAEMREAVRSRLTAALQTAFPELFSDPPTAWLAPMVATEEMVDAADAQRDLYAQDSHVSPDTVYEAMRDAFLKGGGA